MYERQYDRRPNTPTPPERFGPFFDKDGSLILDWVGKNAQDFAEKVSEAKLKATGLRNFYNEFLRIDNLPESYNEEKLILIRLLISKAYYKKTTAKLPHVFVNFIESLVKEVGNDLARFNKACLVMEAIVGYFKEKSNRS